MNCNSYLSDPANLSADLSAEALVRRRKSFDVGVRRHQISTDYQIKNENFLSKHECRLNSLPNYQFCPRPRPSSTMELQFLIIPEFRFNSLHNFPNMTQTNQSVASAQSHETSSLPANGKQPTGNGLYNQSATSLRLKRGKVAAAVGLEPTTS